jgi:hypothetical protein
LNAADRDPPRPEGGEQEQQREADDRGGEQRDARGDLLRLVAEAGGASADVGGGARAAQRGGDGGRPYAIHERARVLVLGPVARRHGDHGGVARTVEDRGADIGDLVVRCEPFGEPLERLVRRTVGQ